MGDIITPVTITRIINHLFSPTTSTRETRKSTKALISPNLVIQFPFLPKSTTSTHGETESITSVNLQNRHSSSAQALSIFRLPGILINRFPGGSWEFEIISCSRVDTSEVEEDDRVQIWQAELEWNFKYETEVFENVPLVGKRVQMKKVFKREVELVFEPVLRIGRTSFKIDRTELKKGKEVVRNLDSPGMDPDADQDDHSSSKKHSPTRRRNEDGSENPFDLLLTKVNYTGMEVPKKIKSIPFSGSIMQIISYLISSILISPIYGVLLLLGLGNSTPSFSPTSSTTFVQRQKKREEAKKIRKTRTLMASFNPAQFPSGSNQIVSESSGDESDASDIQFEASQVSESTYHHFMRSTYELYRLFTTFLTNLSELCTETKVEFVELFYSYRDLLRHLVESAMVGVNAFLGWVDHANEEGEEISRRERESLERDIGDVIYGTNDGRHWNTSGTGRESYSDQFSRISSMRKSPSSKSATGSTNKVAFNFTSSRSEDPHHLTSSLFGPNLDQAELRRRTNPQNYSSIGYSTASYGPRSQIQSPASLSSHSRSNVKESFPSSPTPRGSQPSHTFDEEYENDEEDLGEEETGEEAYEDRDQDEGTGYETRPSPIASGSGLNRSQDTPHSKHGIYGAASYASTQLKFDPTPKSQGKEEKKEGQEDEEDEDDLDSNSTITATEESQSKPQEQSQKESQSTSSEALSPKRFTKPLYPAKVLLSEGSEEEEEANEEEEEEISETSKSINPFRSNSDFRKNLKKSKSKEFGDFFPNLRSFSKESATSREEEGDEESITDTKREFQETKAATDDSTKSKKDELINIVQPSNLQSRLDEFESSFTSFDNNNRDVEIIDDIKNFFKTPSRPDVSEEFEKSGEVSSEDESGGGGGERKKDEEEEDDEKRFGDAVGEERGRLGWSTHQTGTAIESSSRSAIKEEKVGEEGEEEMKENYEPKEELGDSPLLYPVPQFLHSPLPPTNSPASSLSSPIYDINDIPELQYDSNKGVKEKDIYGSATRGGGGGGSSSEFSTRGSEFNYSPITPGDSPLHFRGDQDRKLGLSREEGDDDEGGKKKIEGGKEEKKIFESEGLGMDLGTAQPEEIEKEKGEKEANTEESKEVISPPLAQEITTEVQKVKKKKNKSKKAKGALDLPLTSTSNSQSSPLQALGSKVDLEISSPSTSSTCKTTSGNQSSTGSPTRAKVGGTQHLKSPSTTMTKSGEELLAGHKRKKGPKGGT